MAITRTPADNVRALTESEASDVIWGEVFDWSE
jgi:hypothetical protein